MKVTRNTTVTLMELKDNEDIEIDLAADDLVIIDQNLRRVLLNPADIRAFCAELMRFAPDETPADMPAEPFRVEAGRYHKRRDGLKSGLIVAFENTEWLFVDNIKGLTYRIDGTWRLDRLPSGNDLVALWPDETP